MKSFVPFINKNQSDIDNNEWRKIWYENYVSNI